MPTLLLDDTWRDTLADLDAPAGSELLVTGEEPLLRDDLLDLLSTIAGLGLRAILHTDLPGLDDDLKVRPFAPFDAIFRVRVPSFDPETYERLVDQPLDAFLFGLRNLQAFAHPFELEVPVRPDTFPGLADTIAEAMAGGRTRAVRLRLDAEPTQALLTDVGAALRDLDARALRMRPRVVLDGLQATTLPVEDLTEVDVRSDDPPGTPIPDWVDDPDVRARRRVWLATPVARRPGFRSHPLDALYRRGTPASVVKVREAEEVYAVVDRLQPDRPALAATDRFGLWIAGRMHDPVLAERFATLCRQVHAYAAERPPTGLADLRVLAHILRRSMKPGHDGEPITMRFETPPPVDDDGPGPDGPPMPEDDAAGSPA